MLILIRIRISILLPGCRSGTGMISKRCRSKCGSPNIYTCWKMGREFTLIPCKVFFFPSKANWQIYLFDKFSWKSKNTCRWNWYRSGTACPPIRIRQNDADPTRSGIGSATLALPIKQLSKSFNVGLGYEYVTYLLQERKRSGGRSSRLDHPGSDWNWTQPDNKILSPSVQINT